MDNQNVDQLFAVGYLREREWRRYRVAILFLIQDTQVFWRNLRDIATD